MKFSKDDLNRIESAVEAAEKRTSGEIVVMAVSRSDRYAWVHAVWMGIGYAIATAGIIAFDRIFIFPFPLWEVLGWQLLGASFFGGLSFLPGLTRVTVPKSRASLRVHREALANFLALGLTETRERTGVLVYLSQLEHRVEILADRGIDAICGRAYWDEQVATIARGMGSGKPVEAIVEALNRIGERLAENFPRRADDTNELPNRVLTDPKKT